MPSLSLLHSPKFQLHQIELGQIKARNFRRSGKGLSIKYVGTFSRIFNTHLDFLPQSWQILNRLALRSLLRPFSMYSVHPQPGSLKVKARVPVSGHLRKSIIRQTFWPFLLVCLCGLDRKIGFLIGFIRENLESEQFGINTRHKMRIKVFVGDVEINDGLVAAA